MLTYFIVWYSTCTCSVSMCTRVGLGQPSKVRKYFRKYLRRYFRTFVHGTTYGSTKVLPEVHVLYSISIWTFVRRKVPLYTYPYVDSITRLQICFRQKLETFHRVPEGEMTHLRETLLITVPIRERFRIWPKTWWISSVGEKFQTFGENMQTVIQ